MANGTSRSEAPNPPTPALTGPRTRAMTDGTNRSRAPAPAAPFRRKGKTKVSTGNQFTEPTPRPKHKFADNAKSLSDIRTALGPYRLSQLPTLEKLSFPLMKPDQSFDWLPLSLHVGYYISPNEKSPHALLPIYANVNSKTRGQPYLHIDTVAKEQFGDIVTRDFEAIDDVDWIDFFQNWEVFVEYVHFLPCLVAMNHWDQLLAQVCYCYLLAWEAKLPKIFWEKIPTSSEVVDILTGLCGEERGQNADGADDNVEHLSPDVASAEGPRLAETGEVQTPSEQQTPKANPGIQKTGVKRFLTERTTLSPPKRRHVQRKAVPTLESEVDAGARDAPIPDSGLFPASSSVVRRISSFKPKDTMGKEPSKRPKTPPQPAYEPLSPARYQNPSPAGVATHPAQALRTVTRTTDVGPQTNAVDDDGGISDRSDAQMGSHSTSGPEPKPRARVSLQDYTALHKAKNAQDPAEPSTDDRTRDKPENTPQLAADAHLLVKQAPYQPIAGSTLTAAGTKACRAWSTILSRSIAKHHKLERKLGDDRRLMELLKKSRGIFDPDYKKVEAEVIQLDGELDKSRKKVEKWVEEKAKVDEKLKTVATGMNAGAEAEK